MKTHIEVEHGDRRITYTLALDYDPHTLEFVILELIDAFVWHGDDGWPLMRVLDDAAQQRRMLDWLETELHDDIYEILQRQEEQSRQAAEVRRISARLAMAWGLAQR